MAGQALFVEAEVSQAKESAKRFAIQGLPTVVFLKNGKEVNRIEGATDKGDLRAQYQAAFASGSPAGGSSPSGGGFPVLGVIATAGVLAGIGWLLFRK
jgi:thiol-disulfide isomerase/thioredoxin